MNHSVSKQSQKKNQTNFNPKPRFENTDFFSRNSPNHGNVSVQYDNEFKQPGIFHLILFNLIAFKLLINFYKESLLQSLKKEKKHIKAYRNEKKNENTNPSNEFFARQNKAETSDLIKESNSLSTSCLRESLNERIINELKARIEQLQKENENLLSETQSQSCSSSGFLGVASLMASSRGC